MSLLSPVRGNPLESRPIAGGKAQIRWTASMRAAGSSGQSALWIFLTSTLSSSKPSMRRALTPIFPKSPPRVSQ